jgi:hypothetical protein
MLNQTIARLVFKQIGACHSNLEPVEKKGDILLLINILIMKQN